MASKIGFRSVVHQGFSAVKTNYENARNPYPFHSDAFNSWMIGARAAEYDPRAYINKQGEIAHAK